MISASQLNRAVNAIRTAVAEGKDKPRWAVMTVLLFEDEERKRMNETKTVSSHEGADYVRVEDIEPKMEHQHEYAPVPQPRRDVVVVLCKGCGDSKVIPLPAERLPAPALPRPITQPMEPVRVPDRPWRSDPVWPKRKMPYEITCETIVTHQGPSLFERPASVFGAK